MRDNDLLRTPFFNHTRGDGRRAVAVGQLDFRPDSVSIEARRNDRALLTPGLLIGVVMRYHWLLPSVEPERIVEVDGVKKVKGIEGTRSRRLFLTGIYTGETAAVNAPVNLSQHNGGRKPVEAPVFVMKAYQDEYTKVDIGPMAVAALWHHRRAAVGYEHHSLLQQVLGIEVSPLVPAYFGTVQEGGVFYAPSIT